MLEKVGGRETAPEVGDAGLVWGTARGGYTYADRRARSLGTHNHSACMDKMI